MYIITKKYKMDKKIFNDFFGPFYPKKHNFLTKWAKMGKKNFNDFLGHFIPKNTIF